MKLVTFGRPMAPHGVGDTRLVSDDVAQRLQKDGALSASEAWPAKGPQRPSRPALAVARAAGVPDQRKAR